MLNKSLLLLVFTIFGSSYLSSQEDETICDKKISRGIEKLSSTMEIDNTSVNQIEDAVIDCLENSAESFLLRGLIELNREDKDYDLSYSYFERARAFGNPNASTWLGYFYKNGWNVQVDLKKSLDYLTEGAALGDPVAIYSLGYYSLKGLGGMDQNYEKALALFSNTSHPMADFWTSLCTYYGLGTIKNKDAALHTLAHNKTENARGFSTRLYSNTSQLKELPFEMEDKSLLEDINDVLDSKLVGNLYSMDWSGSKIFSENYVSFEVDIKNNKVDLMIDSLHHKGSLISVGNGIIMDDLTIDLPRFDEDGYSDYKEKNVLKSIVFYIDNSETFYVAKFNTWIPEIKEPGRPIYATFYSQSLLNEQIRKSIKINPNPFRSELQLSFELIKPSEVSVKIYDLLGSEKITIDLMRRERGEHDITINGTSLTQGIHLVTLLIDNTPFSNQVIKVD